MTVGRVWSRPGTFRAMGDYSDPPAGLVGRVRTICTALPEIHEEPAWVGTRWRIRTRTFAQVLDVHPDSPPVLASAADLIGAATIVAFRSGGEELEALRHSGPPFLFLGWGRNAMGLVLGDDTDWDEVRELVTESYCLLAPHKLAALVDRPEPA